MLSECEHFRHALNSNPDVAEAVLESAIELAWIMSTLLPPSSACEPPVYYQEWQELVTTSGSLDSTVTPENNTDYKLIYCRPVLFFGAEGTVGKPGAVKCFPVKPLLLQTIGNEPELSQLNSQKLLPANLKENLSGAVSTAKQGIPLKVVLSHLQTSNPAAYGHAQLSAIADSKSTATNGELVRSTAV